MNAIQCVSIDFGGVCYFEDLLGRGDLSQFEYLAGLSRDLVARKHTVIQIKKFCAMKLIQSMPDLMPRLRIILGS